MDDMIEIEYTKKATKQMKKLKNPVAMSKLMDLIEEIQPLSKPDDHKNVIQLVNHQYTHRVSSGDYRALLNYSDNEKIKIAHVEEVKKRDERTY